MGVSVKPVTQLVYLVLQYMLPFSSMEVVVASTMEDPPSMKFIWTIDKFTRLNTNKLYSMIFVVGGYRWRILIFPKGNNVDYLSIYLDVADSATLPYGWSKNAQFSLTVVNQIRNKPSVGKETHHLFNARESDWGFTSFMPLTDLSDPSRGYLVNDTVVIEAEVICSSYNAQAHLYAIIKVAQDEDLFQQIGSDIHFDLVDHDKVRSFRIQKQTPFSLFKEEVAKEFGVPVQFQRFWIWAKRVNHTYRPSRALTAQDEAQSVGQLMEMNKIHKTELNLFLEVEFGLDLYPIRPPLKSKEDILLFFKLYDPEKGKLRYVGRLFVKSSGLPIEILAKLNQMAGFAADEEIELYEEIKFEPRVMCEYLDKKFTFRASQIEDGDIICFQKARQLESEEECQYPDVPSFLEYLNNREIVHFRSLEKPKEDDFCLELSKTHSYNEVVERVARQIGLDDPSKIRLTCHNCYSQQPKPQPINYRGVEHLSDMLVHYDQKSDILYYEVLEIPLPELQGLKRAPACMRQYQKKNSVPTMADEEDDTPIPPSPILSASVPMATSAVASTQGLTGSTTQHALTLCSQPTDKPATARTISLPEREDIGTIFLDDVDVFFQSLSSNMPVPSGPAVSTSPISTSQVSKPSKEEIEEALKQIKEALQMPPVQFDYPGRISTIEKALQTLSDLDESSGITIGQNAYLLSLTEKFKTLPARASKAIKAKDNLAQKETLKTTLDQNLESYIAHFTVNKAEIVQAEQEIQELKAKQKEAETKKETLATEIKELYKRSLLDKKELDGLNMEMPKYEEEAKAGEEEEKAVNKEWNNMMDFVSNISANLKY